MVAVRKVINEHVIRYSSEGADKVVADAERIAKSEERVAAATEKTASSNKEVAQTTTETTGRRLSAQAAVDRLQRSIDLEYRATQQMAQAQKTLDRAYSQGHITLSRHNELLGIAQARYDSGIAKARGLSAANDNVAGSFASMAGVASRLGPMLATIGSAMALIGSAAALGGIAKAGLQMESLERGFAAAAGSAEQGAREFTFIRDASDRLGLALGEASTQYLSFLAASRGTALQGQATRDIFLAVTAAMGALGKDSETTSRALIAVQQMMSKGKVSAEEMTGQLGEALPGALSLSAKAMGMTQQALLKLMGDGKLFASDLLPKLAKELQATYGEAATKAANGLQANLNRMKTAWTDLQDTIARNGFNDALSRAAGDMASFLRDSKAGADGYGRALASVVDMLRSVGAAAVDAYDSAKIVLTMIGEFDQALGSKTIDYGSLTPAGASELAGFLQTALEFDKEVVNKIVGVFAAGYEMAVAAWEGFPAAFGGLGARAANALIAAIESAVNVAVRGFNTVVDAINGIGSNLPGFSNLSKAAEVSFGRIEAASSKTVGQVASDIAEAGKAALSRDYLGEAGTVIVNRFNELKEASRAAREERKRLADQAAGDKLADALKNTGEGAKKAAEDLDKSGKAAKAAAKEFEDFKSKAEDAFKKLFPEDALRKQGEELQGLLDKYRDQLAKIDPRYVTAIETQIKLNLDGKELEGVKTKADDTAKELSQAFRGVFDEMFSAGNKGFDGLLNSFTKSLSRIGSRLLEQNFLAPLFSGKEGAGAGGGLNLFGGFGNIDFSKIQKAVSEGSFDGLVTASKEMISSSKTASGTGGFASSKIGGGLMAAGVGGSIGYQSQNPIIGALGGAASGYAMGGPVGAVIGGAAGLIGGLFGKSEAKKAAQKKLREQLEAYREAYKQAEPEIKKLEATFRGQSLGNVGEQIDAAFQQMYQANVTASKAGDQARANQLVKDFEGYAVRLRDQFMFAFEGTLKEVSDGFGTSGPFAQANAAIASLGESLKAFVKDSESLPVADVNSARARAAAQQAALAALDPPKALSDTQSRLAAIQGTAAGLSRVLQDLGMSADDAATAIRDRTAKAMDALRASFSADLDSKINTAKGQDYKNEIGDLVKERDALLADANAIGAGTSKVSEYFRLSAQKVINDSELTGSAFDALVQQFPQLKGSVVEFSEAVDTAAAKAEAAARRLGYQDRAFAAGNDTSTLAGALAAQDRKAAQDRAAEAKAGGQAMRDLEKALAAERAAIIKDFAAQAAETEKAAADERARIAEAAAARTLSAEDRLFAARNDTSTQAGALAAFDRKAAQERADEAKEGGQALKALERAQAAERTAIIKDFAAKAAAQEKAAAEERERVQAELAARRLGYQDRLFSARTDTSTEAGALAAFDRKAAQDRAAEAKAGGKAMKDLERALGAERASIIKDFAARAAEAEREIAARRLSAEDRLFAARNDTSTLAGQLAAFDRQAARERLAEAEAGGQAMRQLEQAQAADRLNIIREYAKKETEAKRDAAVEAMGFLTGTFRSYKSFIDELNAGSNSTLSPGARYNAAKSQFGDQLALTKSSDPSVARDALSSLTQYASTFLEASKAMYASGEAFQADRQGVINALADIPKQVDAASLIVSAIDSANKEQIAKQELIRAAAALTASNVVDTTSAVDKAKDQNTTDLGKNAPDKISEAISSLFANLATLTSIGDVKTEIGKNSPDKINTAISGLFSNLATITSIGDVKTAIGGTTTATQANAPDKINTAISGLFSSLATITSIGDVEKAVTGNSPDKINTAIKDNFAPLAQNASLTGTGTGTLNGAISGLFSSLATLTSVTDVKTAVEGATTATAANAPDKINTAISGLFSNLATITSVETNAPKNINESIKGNFTSLAQDKTMSGTGTGTLKSGISGLFSSLATLTSVTDVKAATQANAPDKINTAVKDNFKGLALDKTMSGTGAGTLSGGIAGLFSSLATLTSMTDVKTAVGGTTTAVQANAPDKINTAISGLFTNLATITSVETNAPKNINDKIKGNFTGLALDKTMTGTGTGSLKSGISGLFSSLATITSVETKAPYQINESIKGNFSTLAKDKTMSGTGAGTLSAGISGLFGSLATITSVETNAPANINTAIKDNFKNLALDKTMSGTGTGTLKSGISGLFSSLATITSVETNAPANINDKIKGNFTGLALDKTISGTGAGTLQSGISGLFSSLATVTSVETNAPANINTAIKDNFKGLAQDKTMSGTGTGTLNAGISGLFGSLATITSVETNAPKNINTEIKGNFNGLALDKTMTGSGKGTLSGGIAGLFSSLATITSVETNAPTKINTAIKDNFKGLALDKTISGTGANTLKSGISGLFGSLATITSVETNAPANINTAIKGNFTGLALDKTMSGTGAGSVKSGISGLFTGLSTTTSVNDVKTATQANAPDKINDKIKGNFSGLAQNAALTGTGNNTLNKAISGLFSSLATITSVSGVQTAIDGVSGTNSILDTLKTSSTTQEKTLDALNAQFALNPNAPITVFGTQVNNNMLTALNKIVYNTANTVIAIQSDGKFGQHSFAVGGYTGPGGKYEEAGIVHRGEIVWSQSDIARAGGVAAVEAMRLGANDNRMSMMPAVPVPTPMMPAAGMDAGALIAEIRALREERRRSDQERRKEAEMVARVTKDGADRQVSATEDVRQEAAGHRADDKRRENRSAGVAGVRGPQAA